MEKELDQDSFDVVILGTGIVESIVAAYVSRVTSNCKPLATRERVGGRRRREAAGAPVRSDRHSTVGWWVEFAH